MKDKVAIVRTVGGEYFIGTVDNDSDTNITLKDTRVIMSQMTPNGVGTFAAPLVPFAIKSPENITINKNYIICIVEEDNIVKDLLNGYKSQITGIACATTPDIIC